ncbi:MAG: amidohydrolase [Emcibacter sp.]|nr:amidohydrolase [Emcibacter sp.]
MNLYMQKNKTHPNSGDMTNGISSIKGIEDVVGWRRHLHKHPETAFEEFQTSEMVADLLKSFGLEVHRGLATTGVVGVLRNGEGPMIGLRADMDALHLEENNNFDHRSVHEGRMHACGHDGHTAMLLGAARDLSKELNFSGTIVFIFQPAEENEAGALSMIEGGLFEKFPVDAVYGLHNWPGMAAGSFGVCKGPIMAALDLFEIKIIGQGTHAAMPHLGTDVLLAAAELTSDFQSIVSRAIDPQQASVVSVTQMHGGNAWNVIPAEVILRGCTRHFTAQNQKIIRDLLSLKAEGMSKSHGVDHEMNYMERYPATVNTELETSIAVQAAIKALGLEKVDDNVVASLGSEDFGFMLKEKPGCYGWLGNGPLKGGCMLHSPTYDFNDEIIPAGIAYWKALAQTCLPLA